MRSRQRGWIMSEDDIPSMLKMIEEKIASSEIEVHHRDTLIRLREILEEDLQASKDHPLAPDVDKQPAIGSPDVESDPPSSSLDN